MSRERHCFAGDQSRRFWLRSDKAVELATQRLEDDALAVAAVAVAVDPVALLQVRLVTLRCRDTHTSQEEKHQ